MRFRRKAFHQYGLKKMPNWVVFVPNVLTIIAWFFLKYIWHLKSIAIKLIQPIVEQSNPTRLFCFWPWLGYYCPAPFTLYVSDNIGASNLHTTLIQYNGNDRKYLHLPIFTVKFKFLTILQTLIPVLLTRKFVKYYFGVRKFNLK